MEKCERCGRPTNGSYPDACLRARLASRDDAADCEMFARGRLAGLREGVEIAKAHAKTVQLYREPWGESGPRVYGDTRIQWCDVNDELARRLGA